MKIEVFQSTVYSFKRAFNMLLLYVLATNLKGEPKTDWDGCNDEECDEGEGDCDNDSQCAGDLICGKNNCLEDYSSEESNWASGADCCTVA